MKLLYVLLPLLLISCSYMPEHLMTLKYHHLERNVMNKLGVTSG